MPNKLCQAGCLGFPVGVLTDPFFPVICRADVLGIEAPATVFTSRQGTTEALGTTVVPGQTVVGGYFQPSFINPWAVQAQVILDMEVGVTACFSQSDSWELYLDVDTSGGALLHDGSATGAFLVASSDGSDMVANANLSTFYHHEHITELYLVNALSTFALGMQGRMVFTAGVAGFRSVIDFSTAMTVEMTPRYV